MPQICSHCAAALLLLCQLPAIAQSNNTTDTATKTKKLKEVTISARKSAIETAPGKTIVNVQAMAGNAGKNVLELLRKTPGVTVDGLGNISISGKQGVMVMIDGRQTYLGGEDLRSLLEGMTADEVAQIEIMTQPSAMYDAEGNSGIINLKTRKTRRQGINGIATLTYTKSVFEGTNNTVQLNYRKSKTNWHTNLNHINAMSGVWWEQNTRFTDAAGNTIAQTSMQSEPVEWFDKYNMRLGADHNYTENTHAGFSATGAYYANVMNTPINSITTLQNGSILNSTRYTNEHSLRKNATANAYFKHSISKKSDVNVNVDYLLYTKHLYQNLNTEADSNGSAVADPLTLRSKTPMSTSIYAVKADYTTTTNNGIKMETGIKHSYVTADKDARFMQYSSGNWMNDASRSNRFLYKEHISALYANSITKLSLKWDMQLGIRGELAQIEGYQEATGERLYRQLPAVFPTAYFSYKPDSANTLELNYGRRVQRPQFGMLNPFNYYTFYNTYQRGNAALLPQYSHNAELNHRYKNHLTTELSASIIRDAITYVSLPDNVTGETYGMPINFGNNRTANIGITYNRNITPWCELTINTKGMYALYRGLLNSNQVEKEGYGYNVWVNARLTKGKWGADVYSSYLSRMIASPVSATEPTIYMNLGFSRKAFHDTTTIRLSIDDPFFIYRNGNEDVQPGLSNQSTLVSNSRYCTMVVTYNFGRNTERSVIRREQGIDEAKRM